MYIIIILFGVSLCMADWTAPVGIPDPADSFGFDPIGIATPVSTEKCTSWANGNVHSKASGDGCDCYYIDNDDPNATDNSNAYGSPNQPRLTVPNVNLSASSYVEIHSGNVYTSFPVRAKGTVDSLIWFVGKGNPQFNVKIDIGKLSVIDSIRYVIFDSFTLINRVDLRPRYEGHHFSNIVFRNCEFNGNSTTGWTGFILGRVPSEMEGSVKNIVIYNCNIHHYGDISNPNEECCIYNSGITNNVWILGNEISYAAEDGIAGGHGAAGTVVNYFVGDNYIHDNHVNGIDFKQDYNVIISQNRIKSHMVGSADESGPAQAIILHYSGSTTGPGIWKNWPNYASVINNVIDSSREGIATSYVTNLLISGNVITNIIHDPAKAYDPSSAYSYGSAISVRGIRGNFIIERNTISGCDAGIKTPDNTLSYDNEATYYKSQSVIYNDSKYLCIDDNSDEGIVGILPSDDSYWKLCTLSIKNNLVINGNDVNNYDLQFSNDEYAELFEIDRNNFYGTGDSSTIKWGSNSYNLSNFQSVVNKCVNCLEVDPSTYSESDLRLTSESSLIGTGEAGYASNWYFGLYSQYIDYDIDGISIPLENSYEIGAYQYNPDYVPNPDSWPNQTAWFNWDSTLVENAVVCTSKAQYGRFEVWDSLYTGTEWSISDSSSIGLGIMDTMLLNPLINGKQKVLFTTKRNLE